jgi:hypothetical protein
MGWVPTESGELRDGKSSKNELLETCVCRVKALQMRKGEQGLLVPLLF